jgi:biopolymer transport protein ExbD
MQLSRPKPPQRMISLVSMIDVLLIMLVFFMVTSTYLNLDMISVARATDENAETTVAQTPQGAPMMIRLGPSGSSYLRGQSTSPESLARQVRAHLAEDPAASILILPSPRANTQSLVTLMDNLTSVGATNLRILQLTAIE